MMTSIEVLSSRQETIDGMRNEVNGDYVHDIEDEWVNKERKQ